MSALGISSAQPPVVSTTLEPESVRNGSTAVKNAYKEGLSFEEMLTEQLTKSLSEMGGLGEGEEASGGEGEGGEAGGEGGALGAGGNSLVSSLLPQALAQGVTAGGGLGLAAQLANEVATNEGAATAGTTQAAVTPEAATPSSATAPSGSTVTSTTGASGTTGGAAA